MAAIGPSSEAGELPAVGETVGGRYRIERTLGAGASGVVYEASHELTGKVVAIKWLRPDLAASEALTARFLREARAACAVEHPNVVAVFDAGRERGTLFLVMERLVGEPLGAYLARGPHAPEALLATLMPALRGVAAAHERGIVHRDLKPDNVFLARPRRGWPGGAKVLDFGISKLKQPADGRELTQAGVFLGSPHYMAPEQILSPSTVDARSDVYSIGVMLYEGLTGRVPFQAEGLHELFRRVRTEPVRPVRELRPEIPAELEALVARAMARERAARPASVRALALELEPFAGGARFEEESVDVPLSGQTPIGEAGAAAGTALGDTQAEHGRTVLSGAPPTFDTGGGGASGGRTSHAGLVLPIPEGPIVLAVAALAAILFGFFVGLAF